MIFRTIFFTLLVLPYIKCKCVKSLSLNLSDGQRINSTIVKGGLVFEEKNYYHENNTVFGCICSVRTCIKKCCNGVNEFSIKNNCNFSEVDPSYKLYDLDRPVPVHKKDFYFVYEPICMSTNSKGLMLPEVLFYIQRNGSLYIFSQNLMIPPDEYCVDTFDGEIKALYCQKEVLLDKEREVSRIVKVIGNSNYIFV